LKYTVRLEKRAERQLEKLPPEAIRRVCQKLVELEQNSRLGGVKKLRGIEGYRLRVGDYRVLFTIDDGSKEVYIYRIKHRKEVYE
jgi:mRNA interferase RelE/StbE